MSVDLDFQVAVRAALIGSPLVTLLVPADRVVDGWVTGLDFPCITIGEAVTVGERIMLGRQHARVTLTLHVWTEEPGTEACKALVGACWRALADLDLPGAVDVVVDGSRVMRDPSRENTAHGTLSVTALLELEALA